MSGLPGFGNYPGPYGPAILRVAVAQTNATGVVSAINFDYRGFDTVGEEFILFAAAEPAGCTGDGCTGDGCPCCATFTARRQGKMDARLSVLAEKKQPDLLPQAGPRRGERHRRGRQDGPGPQRLTDSS
jgi:hypothetical protein